MPNYDISRPVDGWLGEDEEVRTRSIWEKMIGRCTDPADELYGSYGEIGIGVCERWLSFDLFVEDMGYCSPGCSLERDELDCGYEPNNCRWIEWKDQVENTKANRRKRDLWNNR